MKFTVYIDESGEAGIAKVRTVNSPGASPYFVLGAVVCEPTAEIHAKNALDNFAEETGKSSWKHATDLSHFEKVLLGKELGRLPVRYFCLISNKSTLKEYKNGIENDPQKFYNKCLKYLLECIFNYLSKHIDSDDDVRVVLEERNHDYDRMIRFLQRVKENPIYPQSKVFRNLNPFAIVSRPKGSEAMLDVADFVAHATYQCTNRSRQNFGIPEPRYFLEIASRFAGDGERSALGVGIKPVHSLSQLNLEPEIEQKILALKVKAPKQT